MAKTKHQLRVYLGWTVNYADQNPYKKFMDKSLSVTVSQIQKDASETGMRHSNIGGILGYKKGDQNRKIEIIFDQAVCAPDVIFGGRDIKRRNFNQLVHALHKLDTMVSDIPEESQLEAKISLHHYQSPWVQAIHNGDGQGDLRMLLRDGYAEADITVKGNLIQHIGDGGVVGVGRIRVVGEPRAVYKVKRELELFSRKKQDTNEVNYAIGWVLQQQWNSNYAIIVDDLLGSKTVYGNSQRTRMQVVNSTLRILEEGFKALEYKYIDFGMFGKDLKVVTL